LKVLAVITTALNDIKERLSVAYVTAIAARAGCQISKLDVDKQSIDATIRPISGRKLCIDLQLKATSSDCINNGVVEFDLPVKNYDDLRDPHSTAHHYLVILVLDPNQDTWLTLDADALLIRRCAYWLDLSGAPATANTSTIKIAIPITQRLDVTALHAMMKRAADAITSSGKAA
jgi:hypothetical protein